MNALSQDACTCEGSEASQACMRAVACRVHACPANAAVDREWATRRKQAQYGWDSWAPQQYSVEGLPTRATASGRLVA